MPLELIQDFGDDDNVMLFNNTSQIEEQETKPIVNYSTLPNARLNADLRNELGEQEINEIKKKAGMSKDEIIRSEGEGVEKNHTILYDDWDTDRDGKVSWSESAVGHFEDAKKTVAYLPTQAGKVMTAGMDYSTEAYKQSKKKLEYIADQNEDGKIDGADLYEASARVGNAGLDAGKASLKAVREGTGLDDIGKGMANSANLAIYVGGAVVLAYLLIKM